MNTSRPHITLKAAMTLDGRIATAEGASKWITGEKARAYSMQLRRRADAILVGVNTVCHDDPSLTVRPPQGRRSQPRTRIILDTHGRIPPHAKVVTDAFADEISLIGPRERIAERLESWRKGPVTDLLVLAPDPHTLRVLAELNS
jgi:diaminohydroxyphosphoribosylaminopyrimidine deaminase/5-amino-6-(5-phosphoribosylamino)uracil reductase